MNSPKLKEYCIALYDKLENESVTKVDEEHGSFQVWQGFITKTARSVNIPEGTYKRVTDKLHELGCIEQVDSGSRSMETTVILHEAPTEEVWREGGTMSGHRLTSALAPAILGRRISDVERRLEGIDLKQAFVEIFQELQKLKDDVKELHVQIAIVKGEN